MAARTYEKEEGEARATAFQTHWMRSERWNHKQSDTRRGVMHDASKPTLFLLSISLSFSLRHTLTPFRHTAAHKSGSRTALDASFIQGKDQKERINSLQPSPSKDLIPPSFLMFL
ncbi:hypothetical protein ILYODFUR_030613 [Ilyodon furcidens]|uniref:Uncharacterized protein n=1 Tax=Ilyodon furcidens TaxID=33524 RepID=A0ABV0UPD7_9TELE